MDIDLESTWHRGLVSLFVELFIGVSRELSNKSCWIPNHEKRFRRFIAFLSHLYIDIPSSVVTSSICFIFALYDIVLGQWINNKLSIKRKLFVFFHLDDICVTLGYMYLLKTCTMCYEHEYKMPAFNIWEHTKKKDIKPEGIPLGQFHIDQRSVYMLLISIIHGFSIWEDTGIIIMFLTLILVHTRNKCLIMGGLTF